MAFHSILNWIFRLKFKHIFLITLNIPALEKIFVSLLFSLFFWFFLQNALVQFPSPNTHGSARYERVFSRVFYYALIISMVVERYLVYITYYFWAMFPLAWKTFKNSTNVLTSWNQHLGVGGMSEKSARNHVEIS